MGAQYKVVLRGFSAFERSALGSYFRLSADRSPGYEQVLALADADFAVADADQPAVVEELRRDGRLHTSVFIGSQAPTGAVAWTMRPIDPLHVMRELDAIAALHHLPPMPAPARSAPSTPRNGSSFEHPQRRASDSKAGEFDDRPIVRGPSPEVALPQVPAPDAPPPRVLMVDDSEVALRALSRQLEAIGLQSDGCANSTLALQALARSRYDLLVVDVELGEHSELDGLALCRKVKQQRHPTGRPPVVVIVSAHAAPVDRVRGTLAGCDAYLAKPLDGAELLHTLQRHGIQPASAVAVGG